MLQIPEWAGNRLLIDHQKYPSPESLVGVLWSKQIFDDRVRIVAFAIDSEFKNKGLGSQAWNLLVEAARKDSHNEIQLEVRGDNLFAIEFYRRRGLEVVSTLEGYYKAGIGYVMRGEI